MTMPPLEARKNYVAHRVEELLDDDAFVFLNVAAHEYDADGHPSIKDYVKAKATEQAEREWAERMDVLLDAEINNLELHR